MEQNANPYINKIRKVQRDQQRGLELLLEYQSGQSFEYYFAQGYTFSPLLIKIYARDLVKAVASIHDKGLVHGNLKSANVLINSHTKHLELTDFQIFRTNCQKADNFITLSASSAPECLATEANTLTRANDVWGIGYVILELMLGCSPWQN